MGFGGEVDPAAEIVHQPVGPPPAAFQGQLSQAGKQDRVHQINLVDQERAGAEDLQECLAVGPRCEQLGAIGTQQGAIETHQQLLAGCGAIVNQGGNIVFFQAGLAADQHRCAAGIGGGQPDRITKFQGVAAAPHDPPPHPAQQQGGKAAQVGRRGVGIHEHQPGPEN